MRSRKKERAEATHGARTIDGPEIAGKTAEAQETDEKPAAFVSARRIDASPKPVLRRLLPSLAVMVILLIVGAWELLYQLHRQQLDREIEAHISQVSGNLRKAMDQQAFDLALATQPIATDATMQKALREGDADRLLADWRPVFETLNREKHLTHFYFFDTNRICLLRVHRPEKRGDRIERFTIIESERTGKTASGMELGSLGTFTLRVVQPVFEDGTLVGYVELGKEIEDVLQINTQSGIQLAVVILKVHLNRQAWEEGMHQLGREADWNRLPRSVVSYASQGRLPDAFASWADSLAADPVHGETDREISFDGKDWGVSAMPLRDASGKGVGDLLLMRDISISKAAFLRLVTLGGTGGVVLLAVLLGLIYVLLRHTDADIHAQQAALREGEERHRTILQTAMDGFWVVDMQGCLLEVNETYCRMSGYSSRELLTMRISDLEAAETAAAIAARIQKTMAQGEDRFETRHHRKDGSVFDVEVSVQYRPTDDGRLVAFLRDITKRKLAEEEREQLMSAIEQSSETILITDTEGTIRYVNPAFENVTGYTRTEAVGWNPKILKSGEQDDAFYREMWETISSGKTWRGRLINKKKDGSLYTEDASISPVLDALGVTVNYVAVKRDITEHLRFEREKAHLEEQYHQAQKVESIGRLAGGVAHDLNNLLTPILGYGEMLLDDFDPDDSRKRKVDQIVQAGLRARDLVRQLLAFSRKQPLEYKPVDMNKAVTGFEKLMRRTIREDIEIKIIMSPDVPIVMADIGQIEQVIMNIAVNAADAMSDGGCLTIETASTVMDEDSAATHQAVKPGEYVMLAVSDTGCGMDKETRAHIFDPFFSTKGEQGTGLGLSTVYGIVKQHGGCIWVYSEPDKGTTFKVYLPVFGSTPVEERTDEKAPSELKGSETILLVEDNKQVRDLGQAVLTKLGYKVLVAERGAEALTLMASHSGPVDLLLTDVVMPGINGKELFTRAAEMQRGLKVLYMSGYTDDVIVHRGVLDKGVQLIQKPFTVKALAAKVRHVIDN